MGLIYEMDDTSRDALTYCSGVAGGSRRAPNGPLNQKMLDNFIIINLWKMYFKFSARDKLIGKFVTGICRYPGF